MATTSLTGGFPDATNTGVPAGTTLKSSGPLVINTPGAVIQGLDISGGVIINAPNVTLLNCKITSGGYDVVMINPGVTGVVVQNCTIDNQGAGGQGIAGQGTFVANNIINCVDGIDVRGDNTVIQDNYIHNMAKPTGAHPDGIQADGGFSNLTIIHNTVVNELGDNSSLMLDNYWGPINNVLIDDNQFLGGGYTVYLGEMANQPAGGGGKMTNITFTNNIVSKGGWGYLSLSTQLGDVPVMSGNVDSSTGALLSFNNSTSTTSPPPTSPGPTAPTIASWSPDTGVVGDGITDANKVTLKGTAAANSTVTVYDGSTKLGTATADSSGSWSYITSVLTDAKHVLTAKATTSSGTSSASAAVNVTVDTAAPSAPVLTGDTTVNTNQLKVSGTAEANSTIKVYDGTTVVGTATTNSSGAWSVTTSALSNGSHSLTATATDAAGNVSAASQALDPVVGPTPPAVPAAPAAPTIATLVTDSGVAGDHITNDNTPTLSGTGVANSTINLFDGTTKVGTATVDSSGHWSLTTKALGDGAHNLTATDTTSAGTSTASGAFSVTIDTHAPTAPTIAAHAQDGTSVGSTTTVNDFVLQGTAEANSTINVFDGGKQIGTVQTNDRGVWSYDTGALSTGGHSFTANATDAAGNVSGSSTKVAETVTSSTSSGSGSTSSGSTSTAPDKVDFTDLQYNDWSDTATIKGTADAYSQVKVYDGTVAIGTVKASANGTWSFTTKSLSDKLHTFTAQELDSHGNVVGTSSGDAMLMGSHTSTLTGSGGSDFMYSSTSQMNDTFVFTSDFGHSTIQGFSASGPGQDTIVLSKSVFSSFASVLSHASQVGQDVVIAAGNDTLTLKNLKIGALNSSDFHFA